MPEPEPAPPEDIRVLPPEVAERIAAGEVVERPASVVRELLDNALDAAARRIAIDLQGGGLDLVRVADDGHGIPAAQVELAFQRYATSKLRHVDDLQRLHTLGFRGEALPSIAAVSEVTLATRTAEAESGIQVTLRAGALVRRGWTAREQGTTVTVRDLFFNVPARQTFMGTQQIETTHIAQLVRRYALAHPGVQITLASDGRELFRSRGTGDPRTALADVYGATLAGAMRPLPLRRASGVLVAGFIAGRTSTRVDRRGITVLVNGRRASTPGLDEALAAAYRPYVPRGRHPVMLVQVEVPAETLDPNVHPAKVEVKLRQEALVAELLAESVRAALAGGADRPPETEDFSLSGGQLQLPRPRRRVAEAPGPGWGSTEPREWPLSAVLRAATGLTQAHGTLILADVEDGLLAVDQHRAHERVIFDLLRGREQLSSQALLEPLVLELTPPQAVQVSDRLEALRQLGFDCERFGGRSFLVRAIPSVPAGEDLASAAADLLLEAATADDRWETRFLAATACRGAVKRGEPLNEGSMRRLLDDLATTASPAACPHGSPTILHFSANFLRRQFRW